MAVGGFVLIIFLVILRGSSLRTRHQQGEAIQPYNTLAMTDRVFRGVINHY